jgi:regulator of sirC expression with transglutaminase-like and TPR domain
MDPFTGQSLSKEDLSERLAPLHAQTGLVRDGDVSDALLKHYLRPATPREIVVRMLRNLDEIYITHGDVVRRTWVKKRLGVLLPQASDQP